MGHFRSLVAPFTNLCYINLPSCRWLFFLCCANQAEQSLAIPFHIVLLGLWGHISPKAPANNVALS
jgi:hypothetical protein